MTDRNGTAVWIDMRRIVGNAQISQNGQRLRGKSFVQLDNIHLREGEVGLRENLFRCRGWTHAHNPRRNACGRGRNNTSARSETMFSRGGFTRRDEGASTVVYS